MQRKQLKHESDFANAFNKKSILKKLKYFLRLSYWQKNMTDKPTWVYILQNLHSPPRYGKIAQQKPSLGKKDPKL